MDFKQLKATLGNRITTDKFETGLYAADLAPIPGLFRMLFRTEPSAIALVQNAEEISEVLKFANANRIPVVPRGSASSGLGGVIPTRNGIVVDLSPLDKTMEIDADRKTVRVSAGVIWKDLERALNQQNLALMSYPSSAPSATIGGWLASWGYGIGNLAFGNVHDQVVKLRVVLPTGEIRDVGGEERARFLGMEGTTGIITEAELKVRLLPESRLCLLARLKDRNAFSKLLAKCANLKPFSLQYANADFIEMMHDAENVPFKKDFEFQILAVFEGTAQELADASKRFDNLIRNFKPEITLDNEHAGEEWEQRFNPMKIKRKGPTLLAGDLLIPLTGMAEAVEKFSRFDFKLGLEGHVVSPDKSIMLTMFLTDERKFFDFLFALTNIKRLNDVAVSVGGLPYGIGLWNSSFVDRAGTGEDIARLRKLKKELDPNSILNPDKRLGIKLFPANLIFDPFVYGFLITVAGIAERLLGLLPIAITERNKI